MALTAEEQEHLVQELEATLERLQALYNQYFMGIEKLEPTIVRKEVERKIQILRKEQIRNTAIRFRFQTQLQKYNTQSTYWRRICRQIEEGTYQRDVMRAKRRTEIRDELAIAGKALGELGDEGAAPVVNLGGMGLDLDDPFAEAAMSQKPTQPPPRGDPDKTPVPSVGSGIHDLHEKLLSEARGGAAAPPEDETDLSDFFQRKSIPPPPPPPPKPSAAPLPRPSTEPSPRPSGKPPLPRPSKAAPTPAPAPKATTKVTEDRMKAIYRAYVAARKKTNEPTEGVSFERIEQLLKKQLATKAGVVDFKVVIKDGKAVIKTVKE